MLEVFAYNAGKGDCIRIHYAGTHNIIIDSGVMRFSPNFKRICDSVIQERETLDALLIMAYHCQIWQINHFRSMMLVLIIKKA